MLLNLALASSGAIPLVLAAAVPSKSLPKIPESSFKFAPPSVEIPGGTLIDEHDGACGWPLETDDQALQAWTNSGAEASLEAWLDGE